MIMDAHHLSPHVVRAGDRCSNNDVILSTECGTREFLHNKTDHSKGPLQRANNIGKRSPSCHGDQR